MDHIGVTVSQMRWVLAIFLGNVSLLDQSGKTPGLGSNPLLLTSLTVTPISGVKLRNYTDGFEMSNFVFCVLLNQQFNHVYADQPVSNHINNKN